MSLVRLTMAVVLVASSNTGLSTWLSARGTASAAAKAQRAKQRRAATRRVAAFMMAVERERGREREGERCAGGEGRRERERASACVSAEERTTRVLRSFRWRSSPHVPRPVSLSGNVASESERVMDVVYATASEDHGNWRVHCKNDVSIRYKHEH